MHFNTDEKSEMTALQRQVEVLGAAAKRAIHKHNEAILRDRRKAPAGKIEMQREVERAVGNYMRLRRRLDELRAHMSAGSGSTRPTPAG